MPRHPVTAAVPSLGDFEQIVILAILRLGKNAYGVTIRSEIKSRTGRDSSPGALYTTLDRFEQKPFVTSRMRSPTPQRRGRPKRFYAVTRAGVKAVAESQKAYRSLMEGLRIPGVTYA